MVRILLPDEIEQRLITALQRAGSREIGGILMGEHVSDNLFRVKDLTVQRHGGTFVSFVRTIQGILNPLKRFFHQTGHKYTQFNYLGEWHSHPSFAPEPSSRDLDTMWEIVEDPNVGANFAVLMVVRLEEADQLKGTVTVFLPGHEMFRGELIRGETAT